MWKLDDAESDLNVLSLGAATFTFAFVVKHNQL